MLLMHSSLPSPDGLISTIMWGGWGIFWLNKGEGFSLFHRRRVPPAQSCSSQAQAQAVNVWDCQGEKTG
jgi:hypothetical protein